jgi:lysozyme
MKREAAAILAFSAGFVAWRAYDRTDANTNFFEALRVMLTPTNNSMTLSAAGLDAIARREGFSAKRYRDADGYSIGYGHFIKVGESFAEPMEQTTARMLLLHDSNTAADAVRAYVNVPLSQNEFDALVSFVYNVGAGAFRTSTLLRLLNAGDYSGAAAQFDRWNKSQGDILPALIARREQEKNQFLA